jgi:hypothetical protein
VFEPAALNRGITKIRHYRCRCLPEVGDGHEVPQRTRRAGAHAGRRFHSVRRASPSELAIAASEFGCGFGGFGGLSRQMLRTDRGDSGQDRGEVQLNAPTIDAIARRVVEPLPTGPRAAERFGLSRAWVYENANRLGALRIGEGKRPRVGFEPAEVARRSSSAGHQPTQAGEDREQVLGQGDLIPIGGLIRIGRAAMSQRGRPSTGQIRRTSRADGMTTLSLRVRAYGERYTIRLGTELDGWTEPRAENELANVCAQIRAGIWVPPASEDELSTPPTFHEHASTWLKRQVAAGIAENTRKDYFWQLSCHMLPFLGSYRVDEITDEVAAAFKEHKLDERAMIVGVLEAGGQIRDQSGRVRRPLSNTSINKLLVLLTRVLDDAVRRGWLPHNPAAKVERLRVRRRKGGILEADELESLIAAAGSRSAEIRERPSAGGAFASCATSRSCRGAR